jgi:hypothetical protein
MHREMLADFDNWRQQNGYKKLIPWDPAKKIPNSLQYEPRGNNNPRLPLDPWFTIKGSTRREPVTGHRRLADFVDSNELGAIITWWHNAVHGTVGGNQGDMNNPARAPRDPVFWRFHKFIDNVYTRWERVH